MAIANETDQIKAMFASASQGGSRAAAAAAEKRKSAFEKMDVQIVTQDSNQIYKASEESSKPIEIPDKKMRVAGNERFAGKKPFQHHTENIDDFIEEEKQAAPKQHNIYYVRSNPQPSQNEQPNHHSSQQRSPQTFER
jgi:hypothetical protein